MAAGASLNGMDGDAWLGMRAVAWMRRVGWLMIFPDDGLNRACGGRRLVCRARTGVARDEHTGTRASGGPEYISHQRDLYALAADPVHVLGSARSSDIASCQNLMAMASDE